MNQRDLTLRFRTSGAIGQQAEDLVVSLYADTLRILDRERAILYRPADIDTMMADVGGARAVTDWIDRLRLWPPDCDRFREVNLSGEDKIEGRLDGEPFGVSRLPGSGPGSDYRPTAAFWDVAIPGEADDELRVSYRWREQGLSEVRLELERRRWRVILYVD